MTQKPSQFRLLTATVDNYIIILPLEQVIQHLLKFQSGENNRGKIIRICYLVVISNLNQFVIVQNRCHSLNQAQFYNVSITPFNTEQQAKQHIKMMQKMNGSQFQGQYVEMLDLLEKEIQIEIIKQYCNKQLQWSEARTNNLIEREEVCSIHKFLNYRGFNQLELLKLQGIWDFIHYYSQKQDK